MKVIELIFISFYDFPSNSVPHSLLKIVLALIVRRVDNAIHGINRYPVDPDRVVFFVNAYLLDEDLSGG